MGYKGQKEEPRVKLPVVNDTTKRKWIYVYGSIQSQAVTPSEDNRSQMRDGEVCISGIWGAVQSTVFTRILLTHASQTLKPLISSVQSLSRVWLFVIPRTHQASLSITNSQSLLSVHWVGDAIQPSHPLWPPSLALDFSQHPGLFKWVSSSKYWPKYWSFSFSISPSNEYSGLISFSFLVGSCGKKK